MRLLFAPWITARLLILVRVCLIQLILLTCTHKATPQGYSRNAVVAGHVYDAAGHPLQGAIVVPFPLEAGTSGPTFSSKTNANGFYILNLPAFGKTRICASLEDKGYPDTTASIFVTGNENEPEVNVTGGATLTRVDIHLPPPDGSVEFIVTDKDSGAAIAYAGITLRRAADPSISYASGINRSGRFKIHLPPRPVTVEIRMGGYAPWSYKDLESGEQSLKLQPTDHKIVLVQLTPIKEK